MRTNEQLGQKMVQGGEHWIQNRQSAVRATPPRPSLVQPPPRLPDPVESPERTEKKHMKDEKVSCEAIVHSGSGEASQRGARVVHGDGIYPVGSHYRHGGGRIPVFCENKGSICCVENSPLHPLSSSLKHPISQHSRNLAELVTLPEMIFVARVSFDKKAKPPQRCAGVSCSKLFS